MPDADRVLLITGASSGIGAATARAAVAQGYRVALAARREEQLAELAEELGGPGRAIAVPCDVSEVADNEALVSRAIEAFGGFDAVFANAGFGATRGYLESDPQHWRAMVLTNVLGVALTIRASLPHLLERGAGNVVLTGSVAGRRALPGSLYSATKWAVTAIAEGLRQELRTMHENRGIRVTLVNPGTVATAFFDNPPDPEHALRDDDVARAVLYALEQPAHVDVNELLIRPSAQRN